MNGRGLSNWNAISEELKKQAIFPLTAEAVINSTISDSEKLEIYKTVANNIRDFHRIMQAQTKVIALLKDNDITSAIMKGAAVAQYYPKPEMRQMGISILSYCLKILKKPLISYVQTIIKMNKI